jgi:hypothetical protein
LSSGRGDSGCGVLVKVTLPLLAATSRAKATYRYSYDKSIMIGTSPIRTQGLVVVVVVVARLLVGGL